MLRRLLCCLAPRSKQRDKKGGDGGSAAAAAAAAAALADAARAASGRQARPAAASSEGAPQPSSPSAEFSFGFPAAGQEPASPLLTPGDAATPAASLTPELFRRSVTPLGSSNTQGAGTPALWGGAGHKTVLGASCTPSSLTPEPRFLFDVAFSGTSPIVTGIPNSVAKYSQEQPVRIHTTPIDQRIERALKAEQRAVRRAKAARSAGRAP